MCVIQVRSLNQKHPAYALCVRAYDNFIARARYTEHFRVLQANFGRRAASNAAAAAAGLHKMCAAESTTEPDKAHSTKQKKTQKPNVSTTSKPWLRWQFCRFCLSRNHEIRESHRGLPQLARQ